MTSAPAERPSSNERLAAMLEAVDITDVQRGLLRERWLDQLQWMGAQARKARRRFLLFRVPVVVGGVVIPALITLLLSSKDGTIIAWLGNISVDAIRFLAFTVSLLVAVCAAAEEVMHFGDRWRHYRRTTELLKTLGWQFLMLNGAFRRYASHGSAFAAFTERVEDTLNEDVEGYLGAIAAEGPEKGRNEIIA